MANASEPFLAPAIEQDIEILNLLELEDRARKVIPKGPFGYISGGSGDELTLRENIAGFDDHMIVPRYLTGLDEPDITTELFGVKVEAPIFCPPMAAHGLAHATAEAGSARGWAAAGCVYTMTTLSTLPSEDVVAASATGPKWFQLYFAKDLGVNRELVARAKAAGATAIVFAVDLERPGNREADMRNDFHFPSSLRFPNIPGPLAGESLAEIMQVFKHGLDWDDLAFIRQASNLPVIVKGLLSPVDARIAVDHGAAAVGVSNHGGRQLDNVPGSIVALPGIAEAVDGRIPIFLDGGVRRGVHVLEALALGASAVGVGRPTLYSLALGGWRGVHAMVEALKREFALAMKLSGVAKVSNIGPELIVSRSPHPRLELVRNPSRRADSTR
jgi:L-lactate oxidase